MDFVDDEVPFDITHESGAKILCLPYCMETNDFSLVLTKNMDGRRQEKSHEPGLYCAFLFSSIALFSARFSVKEVPLFFPSPRRQYAQALEDHVRQLASEPGDRGSDAKAAAKLEARWTVVCDLVHRVLALFASGRKHCASFGAHQ